MARPIPDLDEMTAAEVATDDSLIIDDTSAGETKRIPVGEMLGIPNLGWTATGETWSFSSFSSTTRFAVITVPSDATAKYSVGMWVRITQVTGGTKFGMITAVTSTTITVNMFGYTLNNEAISTPYYSPLSTPYGAPALPYKFTDANGWTVYDYGIWKQFERTATMNGSNIGAGSALTIASYTVPVGQTNDANIRWWFGVRAGYLARAIPGFDTNNTTAQSTLALQVFNLHSWTINPVGFIYVYGKTI